MENHKLISVIVPIYGVEKYINRCVDSIIAQNYFKLEIILIDDGSPDNCPQICDEYARKDKRIKVIHKENGGLSIARNQGLEISSGEFICFVDGDDWIDINMINHMYNLISQYHADFIQVSHQDVFDDKIKDSNIEEKIDTALDKDILQKYLLDSTKRSGEYVVWKCLFKKKLLDGIKFRDGKINEDIDFKYKYLSRCHLAVYSNKPLYFYYHGNESLSTGGLKKRDFQLYEAAEELYKLTKDESYGTIAKLGKVKKARTAYSLLAKISYFGIDDSSINKKEVIKSLKRENRKNWKLLMCSPIDFKRKIIITMFCFSYRLTEFVIKLVE